MKSTFDPLISLPFEILSIDPLGQGVSKRGPEVTFIPKTLPGEKGVAKLMKKGKGVQFALVLKLSESSPERITPECPHFENCFGCHFLHTSYARELEYKKNTLLWYLNPLLPTPDFKLQVIPTDARFGHRNRLQLHYNLAQNQIGFIHPWRKQIVAVSECLLPLGPIREKLQELYQNSSWKTLAPTYPNTGHCEIYLPDPLGPVQLTWNQDYAHGGFTQVNPEMNTKLKNLVSTWASGATTVMDLFGGNGNLSQELALGPQTLVVDYQASPAKLLPHQKFMAYDLLKDFSPENFLDVVKTRHTPFLNPDLVLLDPPRKGLPALKELLPMLRPKFCLYVSCSPATLARDLKGVLEKGDYVLHKAALLDLFPGSYHFESVVLLKQKSLL